jgi:type I restriction enzyme S subunit
VDIRYDYKHSEVRLIPPDWDDLQLEEIADDGAPICYGIVQVGSSVANGVPVLAIKNLNTDYATNVHRASVVIEQRYARSRIRPGDILISVKGTTGRVGMVPPGFYGNISRDIARLRLKEKVVPHFCLQMLQSHLMQRRLTVAVVGTTRMELSIATLKQVRSPLPPTIAEQEAIADALSDADAFIESLEQLVAKKRRIKDGAIQELLTGKTRLPGFGGEWEVKRLGDLGDITSAGVDKKSRAGEVPVRLVNYLDVYRKDFLYSHDLNHWVTAPVHQARRCAVKKGDVFFTPSSETRDDIGMSAVAMEDIPDAAYSYHVVRLRLKEHWDLRFRTYAFKTRAFLSQAETLCDGNGTRYVISLGKFRSMTVRMPPAFEQAAIAEVLSDIDGEIAALEAQLAKVRKIKQGMMHELLTGRVRFV